MPGPCSEEKVHLLFGHLSDTLIATFLCQSLHELAWRNTVCRERENFFIKQNSYKERVVLTQFFSMWYKLRPLLSVDAMFLYYISKLRKCALRLKLKNASMLFFLCPEIPNPEVLLRKDVRHGAKSTILFLVGNANVMFHFNGLYKLKFQNTHDLS